jgi:four helix bundle protein
LVAYQLCFELVKLMARVRIAEPQLRLQARKSAASAALNAAEGAAKESAGDKRRSYGIASGEACECCAAVEIAGALGACSPADVQAVLALVVRIRRCSFRSFAEREREETGNAIARQVRRLACLGA